MDTPTTKFAPPDYKYIQCDAEDCDTIAPQLRCSRCHLVYYCSKECQRKHWPSHKIDCRFTDKIKAEAKEGVDYSDDTPVQTTAHNAHTSVDMITCAICLEDAIENPHTLSDCQHVFCLSCLKAYQSKCKQMRQPLRCPLCRRHSEDIERKKWEASFFLTCQAGKKHTESLERKELLRLALLELEQMSKEDMKLYIQGMITKISILEMLGDHDSVLAIIQELVLLDNTGRANADEILKRLDEAPVIDEVEDEVLMDLAEFDLDSVVRLMPNDRIGLFIQKASTYEAMEDWRQALQAYKDVFLEIERLDIDATAPQQRSVFMGLSRCFYHLQDYDKAIGSGEAAIEMNRHFPLAHKYVALSYKAKGDLETAIKLMTQAVFYETPWDEDNIRQAKILLDDLIQSRHEPSKLIA